MDNKTPCYGCERRTPLCHGSCEEYKAYAQARADRSRIIRSKRSEESMVTGVLVKAAEKTMRDKKKG